MSVYKGIDYYDPVRPQDRRFKPGAPRKVWKVSKIWDNHEEIIRRLCLGQSNVEIADSMNLSPQLISNVRNSPIVQDKLTIMQGARDAYTIDLARDIKEFAPKALDLLKSIINGDEQLASPALKARVACDLLDRAGYAPIKQMQVQSVHATLSKEDIEELKRRAFTSNAPLATA